SRPRAEEMKKRRAGATLGLEGRNAKVVNTEQQAWLSDVATKAVLPMFKARDKPFLMVFWSRHPDASQHGQRDSIGRLLPGINGPSSLAAIKNADDTLARLLAGLK